MRKAFIAGLLLLMLGLVVLVVSASQTSSQPSDPVAVARQYLAQNASRFGLRSQLDDLRLIQTKESLAAYHVRFQQTFGGVPVFAAFTTVNMSKADNQVSLVLNRYQASLRPAVTQALVSSDQAIAFAEEAVGLQGEPRGLVSAEQVYFPVEKTYFLAWQVQVPAREPLGDWLVVLRADNGEVLLKQNVARSDSGRVFDPNPVQTGAPPPPPPPSDCDSAANATSLSPEYRTQTLLGIQAAQNKLKGQYVDLCAPGILGAYKPACQADEASRNYTYACNDDRFEEVMTYYHIDAAQRKIQSLGFTGNSSVINRPIPAHAHYFDDCNAFYSPWDRGLHFGDSNNALCSPYVTDAAEDADVIVHEYGHAVQDDQVPAWGVGDPLAVEQAAAMGEGFGDFLASAVYGDPCEGEWFSFGETACGGQPGGRWLQNTKVYPTDFEACRMEPGEPAEEHCAGEIWGGALWDLVEALGNNQAARDLALRLVLDSHFYLDPVSTFSEGLSAIRQADTDLYGGSHISTINSVFAARGITYVGSDPPPDFPYVYFRIRHTWVGDLVVRLKVGNPASPSCNLLLWNHEGGSADDLIYYLDPAGTACAPYLPPSVGTPWWLEAQDTVGGDTGYIGDFQVALSGSQRCVATDVPVNIPDAGSAVYSKVDCSTIVVPPPVTPTVTPLPDLLITKTASPADGSVVSTGSSVTYTLTASNSASASATATNVLIRDWLGTGLTFVSITGGSGVTCTDTTGPDYDCTAASIPPGQSRTVTVVATVSAAAGATVLEGAYVDPTNAITETNEDADDPTLVCSTVGEGTDAGSADEPDNFDCTSHSVAEFNITVTKTASPADGSTVSNGATITYTLTTSNSASATATASNVAIRDTIGAGLSLSSVTAGTGVTCSDIIAPEINCTAASIAPGESRTVTIAVTVTATNGTVLNGARVDPANVITEPNEDADDPDRDCAAVGEGTDTAPATEPDNFDCTGHTVQSTLADLTITKTASPPDGSSVAMGSTITYTLTVSNIGGATIASAPIRDYIGAGMSLNSVTPGTGVTCSDTTPPEINCTASVAPGDNRTVTIAVTVTATSGTVLNGAKADPDNAYSEMNDDADDPDRDCATVGEGSDAVPATEPDNFDCTSHTVGPEGVVLRIEPPVKTCTAGQPCSVDVVVDNVANLGSFEIVLDFDPSVITFDHFEQGPFLGSTGRDVSCNAFHVAPGSERYGCASGSATGQPGATGSGVLATVWFGCVGEGECDLHLHDTGLYDATQQVTPIPHAVEDGHVICSACRSDVDNDGDVDIRDVALVFANWPSPPKAYDPKYDLDSDGDIDIRDVALVFGQWPSPPKECAL